MKNLIKHQPATPLPWTVQQHGPDVTWVEGSGPRSWVAKVWLDTDGEGEKNAAYINHAANAYPMLVEALRDLIEHPSNAPTARAILGELGEAS